MTTILSLLLLILMSFVNQDAPPVKERLSIYSTILTPVVALKVPYELPTA